MLGLAIVIPCMRKVIGAAKGPDQFGGFFSYQQGSEGLWIKKMMNSYKLGQVLFFRGLSLIAVLCSVLLLLVITLGASGYSDKILTSNVDEELRGLRGGLAQTIRDPNELNLIFLIV